MRKLRITVQDKTYEVLVEDLGEVTPSAAPTEFFTSSPAPAPAVVGSPSSPAASQKTVVEAPMNGTVVDISVLVGDTVQIGDPLLTLEAMKMQNNIPSPKEGTIREILVRKGDAVSSGESMIIID